MARFLTSSRPVDILPSADVLLSAGMPSVSRAACFVTNGFGTSDGCSNAEVGLSAHSRLGERCGPMAFRSTIFQNGLVREIRRGSLFGPLLGVAAARASERGDNGVVGGGVAIPASEIRGEVTICGSERSGLDGNGDTGGGDAIHTDGSDSSKLVVSSLEESL